MLHVVRTSDRLSRIFHVSVNHLYSVYNVPLFEKLMMNIVKSRDVCVKIQVPKFEKTKLKRCCILFKDNESTDF